MKKLNTILFLALIVANINSVVFADINKNKDKNFFIGVTYTPKISSDLTYEAVDYSSYILGLYAGHKKLISEKFGMYIGLEGTLDQPYPTWEPQVYHDYSIINLGITYSPIKKLTFLAGVGYSQDSVNESILIDSYYDYDGLVDIEEIVTLEENSDINFNMEVMYQVKFGLGIIAGYNSVPNAFNIGLSISF